MLNKKVLVAAVIGGLFAGNAGAVDLSAGNAAAVDATVGVYAKELKTGTTNATYVTLTASAGNEITWVSGLNYSPSEMKYVRVEAAPHVLFQSFTPNVSGATTGGLTAGAVNGVGTNVITFSVTADAVDGASADAVFDLPAVLKLKSIADSTIKVSLYDTASQAQQGGTNGLNTFGSFSGNYIAFDSSLKWVSTAQTATAAVSANPSYSQFLVANALVNTAVLNTSLGLATTGTLAANGIAVALNDLLDTTSGKSSIVVKGDFSYLADEDGDFDPAQVLGAGGAVELAADTAVFDVGTSAFQVTKLQTATWKPVISATSYTASLDAVPVAGSGYNVPVLADKAVGSIVRDGTTLQAPFVQIPENWKSRLVLTNTGSVARTYTISLMKVNGEAVTAGTLTGTIPAKGTTAIDDLKTVFTGNNRATLNVDVAAPSNQIQGLYQIVNPEKGSISNHVLVRPGSN